MQIIDLTKPSNTFKVMTFPDGEVHLELAPLNRKESVFVHCRITNATDLFILMQLADILKRQCIEVDVLDIYYLMGMRCDRLFDIGRPFTLGIVADVINGLNAHKVNIYEPHSARSYHLINHALPVDVTTIIQEKLLADNPGLLLVAPDKGSVMRYDLLFAVTCTKVRDESTGTLLGFEAEEHESVKGRDLLMIDDLCDGGGTFMGLAPKVRGLQPKSLSLIVTHAVQKAGIEKVASVYDKVYITDSYKDWSKEILPSNVIVYKLNDSFF